MAFRLTHRTAEVRCWALTGSTDLACKCPLIEEEQTFCAARHRITPLISPADKKLAHLKS